MKRIKFKTFVLNLVIMLFTVLCVGCNNYSLRSEKDKPKIGIAWIEDFTNEKYSEDFQVYIDGVEKAGGAAVILPRVKNEAGAKEVLATVDGLIMTGGEDINPSYYGEKPHKNLEKINSARDTSDYWLIKVALKEDVPMLATCRGLQMLNAVCGGTLYQDIPTQYKTDIIHRDPKKENFVYHKISVKRGSHLCDIMGSKELTVNSWHHQCIKDLGKNLEVVATAPDGIIEAVEYKGATFVEALQFHPEWHVHDGDKKYINFFKALVRYSDKRK
ncbi:gamma-glutamyl-gamma-aminobutyrate hydrolase family protein [Fusobacterium sp. MFO224]|uniref:gamma-glutamyl-gamma-aminobutyrate hydrolase family protein n=1 Tax=Fusobacterium sp. MFO224 TaxID=3378070 RepID=UPI003852E244